MTQSCCLLPKVVQEFEKLDLPGMVIPDNVVGSGRKSFTLPPPETMNKELKSIEVKFYPYPGSKTAVLRLSHSMFPAKCKSIHGSKHCTTLFSH